MGPQFRELTTSVDACTCRQACYLCRVPGVIGEMFRELEPMGQEQV